MDDSYHNISHSVPQMVFRIITVQMVLRIVTAVTILKKHLCDIMGYIKTWNLPIFIGLSACISILFYTIYNYE